MNIFEQATREKFRFPSSRGELTTEQLWDLPLQSKGEFDLDAIAKEVNRRLKVVTEDSFVSTNNNPVKDELSMMLEVVKHVINVKLKEAEDKRTKAEKAQERVKLIKLLEEKNDEALKSLTSEEIAKRIKELE